MFATDSAPPLTNKDDGFLTLKADPNAGTDMSTAVRETLGRADAIIAENQEAIRNSIKNGTIGGELKIPITIAGMSFGALSGNAKEALGRGARLAGTSTTTGDGGMTEEERVHSEKLVGTSNNSVFAA